MYLLFSVGNNFNNQNLLKQKRLPGYNKYETLLNSNSITQLHPSPDQCPHHLLPGCKMRHEA